MDTSELLAAGLYDPASPDADDRLALLKHLDRVGVSVDEMTRALATGDLVDLAGHKRLAPGALTIDDLAGSTGLSREQIERIWTWAGLPPRELEERRFSDTDV